MPKDDQSPHGYDPYDRDRPVKDPYDEVEYSAPVFATDARFAVVPGLPNMVMRELLGDEENERADEDGSDRFSF